MDIRNFRDSPPDHISSRHSSPLSVISHDSRTDSSPSIATLLLGSSPRMDSYRVVIDLSLKTMEPTGRISDYDSSRKFLLDFHRYRQSVVDVVTSSAPKCLNQICFKFYDTSIFQTPPSLHDLYEYEEDSYYQFLSKPFLYIKRRMNQFKACKAKAILNIPFKQRPAVINYTNLILTIMLPQLKVKHFEFY
jgi:hypothetical protein